MTTKRNPSLPYYGSTREELAAQNIDPDEYEAGRLSHLEWREQKTQEENLQLVAAAQDAVARGDATYAEAAQALLAAGKREAHDGLVSLWQSDEQWYAQEEAAEANRYLDADGYAQLVAAADRQILAEQEAEAEDLKRRVTEAQITELQSDLRSLVESTPGVHQYAPQVEERLVQKLKATGVLPSTPTERAAVLEEALKETAVIGDATESVREQVNVEWRLHRKQSGARDGLMTAGDIARAEASFKEARFKQLADSRVIDLQALKPGPTSEEQSAALTERYREKQAKSTDFHTNVGDIAERAAHATVARDHGVGIGEGNARYREAVRKAEAEASYGTVTTSLRQDAPEASAKPAGYGPDGSWPDELGPAI